MRTPTIGTSLFFFLTPPDSATIPVSIDVTGPGIGNPSHGKSIGQAKTLEPQFFLAISIANDNAETSASKL